MKFSDATGGYKCWRRETLETVDLDQIFSNGYLFQIETTYRTFRKKLRIAEVPSSFMSADWGNRRSILRSSWKQSGAF
jgi:dolichol-phosphate mannosyltransferase